MELWTLLLIVGCALGSAYIMHRKNWRYYRSGSQRYRNWPSWPGGKNSGLQLWNQDYFSDEELWDSDGDLGRPYREWPKSVKPEYDYNQFLTPLPRKPRKPRVAHKYRQGPKPHRTY